MFDWSGVPVSHIRPTLFSEWMLYGAAMIRQGTWLVPFGTGRHKTVFWSYPIIKDGLIYVIDVRNGLFVFQYTGPHADEVNEIHFLECNTNLGDAVDLDEHEE